MNTNTINKQTATPHQPRMCSSVASQDHVLAMMVSPQVKIKIEPPTKKCKTGSDEPAPVIFDMTGLDDNEDFTVGASLDVIRKQHSLIFFTIQEVLTRRQFYHMVTVKAVDAQTVTARTRYLGQ